MISSFELQTIIIVNFKPHRLLHSLIFNYDRTTFCSRIVYFGEAIFCLWSSKSPPPFFNLLPLVITTFNIKKTTISLLIVNSNELDQKDQRKRLFLFKHKKEGNDSNCHRLLRYNKTRKKKVMAGTVIALFLAKKKKKKKRRQLDVTFFVAT